MNVCAGTWRNRKFFLGAFISVQLIGIVSFCALDVNAQVNSWTNPVSGNWEDPSWSLGSVPGTNQDILLANAGWKAVQIAPSTAQNFPQSLNVKSIEISSPTNSFNTLLLNYAGFQTQLTVQAVSVESNSAMTMFSSALQLNGGNGVGLQVGGQFNQNDSIVAGRQINVGNIGPGVYDMNSGFLAVSNLWVGGSFGGVFNQNGGTNAVGITHLEAGEYVLSNGFFGATIYFNGGSLRQQGGLLGVDLSIFNGSYLLAGGTHQGDTYVPWTDGISSGNGAVLQTGGANNGSLYVGSYGAGSYTLSNGVIFGPWNTVDYGGSFNQWGGMQTVSYIDIIERQVDANTFLFGSFVLNAGQTATYTMNINGHYTQSGGTNLVGFSVATGGSHGAMSLSGGLFAAYNIEVDPSFVGGAFLSGGTLVVSNRLLVGGNGLPGWQGFVMSGGQLAVSNIALIPQARFTCSGGTVSQSGVISLAAASLYAGATPQSFGGLLLDNSGNTNSTLIMPAGGSIMHFAASSSMTWSNGALLSIENWSGSLFGGGQQRVVFGNNSAGLTSQQLSQIQFHNPAGLATGTYPAKILSAGEIVPDSGVPSAQMAVHKQTNGMQIVLQGQAGRSYRFETSTDLVHWQPWMTQMNSGGTISVSDTQTTNYPARFYRAALLP